MENLLNFPLTTVVDKLIPKAKFVKASDTPSSIRELLVKEVEQIRLLYIIREDTVNIPTGKEVQEIDVFYIRMKEDVYSMNLFCALDKLIPRHSIYILQYGNNIDVLMQHKQRTILQGSINWKVITSEVRQHINLEEINLRIEGTNLDNVYVNLLAQVSLKQIESIDDYTEQKAEEDRVTKLLKQIHKLEALARKETQPRQKFAMVQEINKLKSLL